MPQSRISLHRTRTGSKVKQRFLENRNNLKSKVIPVTGHEGLKGCETSRLSHFVDKMTK
jgi:hypothetical protein